MAFFSIRRFLFVLLAVLATGVSAAAQQTPMDVSNQAQSSKLQDLIDVLRDDTSRDTLLNELEKATGVERPEKEPLVPVESGDASIGHRIAEVTRHFAETTVSTILVFSQQLAAVPGIFAALNAADGQLLVEALRDLALVIVVTYGVFAALRLVTRRIDRAFGQRAKTAGFLEKALLIGASAVADTAVVVGAWSAGYLAALLVFGETGRMDIQQTLYLNAFTAVQLAKVVIRSVLSPDTADLRIVTVSDAAARRTSSILAWIVGILGYGQLLVQPVLAEGVSLAFAQAVSALVAIAALICAIAATLANRQDVTAWLLQTSGAPPRHQWVRFVAGRWHWPVLAYLTFLFFVALIGPADRLFSVLAASGQAFCALIAGVVVADWLASAVIKGVRLPDNINQRLPLLEGRVNGLAPRFLAVLRLIVLISVLGAVSTSVGILDAGALIQSPAGLAFTAAITSVFFILLFAYILWLALTSWVDYRLNPAFGSVATAREATLLSLLRNAVTIVIVVIALMFSLSELGLDIAPLLASAGVLGLAIGFGAQKLVQDVINGVFIQLENAINVGDVITVGAVTGAVERLTIRSVSLRDLHGSYHIISFSSVDMVTNLMRDFSYHVGDIGIAYREDVEEVRAALFAAFEDLCQDADLNALILADMEWFGVQELAYSAVIVRVRIKTLPGKQWQVGRALNGAVKRVFDARGIELPFPHQTIYFGADKNGDASSVRARVEDFPARTQG